MLLVSLVVTAADGGIGASDCERLRDGALAQPVNTVTSLAYTAVGVAIAIAARHRAPEVRTPSWVFGAVLAAVGIGSVLFHGPQPTGSRLAHDLPIALAVAFIVVWDLRHLTGRPRQTLRTWLAISVPLTALAAAAPDVAVALTGVGAAVVAALEFRVARSRPRSAPAHRRPRVIALLTIAALAAGSYVLGRTGSPACDPESTIQFHGLWHLMTAAIFWLWWTLAFPSEPADDPAADREVVAGRG